MKKISIIACISIMVLGLFACTQEEAVRSIDRVQLVNGSEKSIPEEEAAEVEEIEEADNSGTAEPSIDPIPATTQATTVINTKASASVTTETYTGDSPAASVDSVNFVDSTYEEPYYDDYNYTDSPAADTSGINWGNPDDYANTYPDDYVYTDYGYGEYYDTGFDDYDEWY